MRCPLLETRPFTAAKPTVHKCTFKLCRVWKFIEELIEDFGRYAPGLDTTDDYVFVLPYHLGETPKNRDVALRDEETSLHFDPGVCMSALFGIPKTRPSIRYRPRSIPESRRKK